MPYQFLLFDADNTLFDFDAAELAAHRFVCQRHGLTFSQESYDIYHRCNAQLWHDFDRGLCTKDFLLVERFRRFLAATGESGDPEAMSRDHLEALGANSTLLPGAEELCRSLCKEYSLYLITNAVASVQRARFSGSAIAPCFRGVFISEDVGCGKPDPAYFQYVFQAVPGMTTDNTLVIGDSLSSDIQGANNADLPCCWFNPKGLPRPEGLSIPYEVRTLPEIRSILR